MALIVNATLVLVAVSGLIIMGRRLYLKVNPPKEWPRSRRLGKY